MRRSIRCKHGFCLDTIGCEECTGAWVSDAKNQQLRRAAERRSAKGRAPSSYRYKAPGAGVSSRGWR